MPCTHNLTSLSLTHSLNHTPTRPHTPSHTPPHTHTPHTHTHITPHIHYHTYTHTHAHITHTACTLMQHTDHHYTGTMYSLFPLPPHDTSRGPSRVGLQPPHCVHLTWWWNFQPSDAIRHRTGLERYLSQYQTPYPVPKGGGGVWYSCKPCGVLQLAC